MFRTPWRQQQSLMARALLRHILKTRLPEPEAARSLAFETSGRPVFPEGLWASLAHSGPIVVAAVSSLGPLGIDVEDTGETRDYAALARTLFPNAGEAFLSSIEEPIAFYSAWTLWEASVKAGNEAWASRCLTEGRPTDFTEKIAARPWQDGIGLMGTHRIESSLLGVVIGPIDRRPIPELDWTSVLTNPLRP
jgi:hypothetical protein